VYSAPHNSQEGLWSGGHVTLTAELYLYLLIPPRIPAYRPRSIYRTEKVPPAGNKEMFSGLRSTVPVT
jgi:hypothetical protein